SVLGFKRLGGSGGRGAEKGTTADTDRRRLAQTERRQLSDCFVSQRSGTRDDADVSFAMNVTRHDPDLALARRDDAGTVGSNQASRLAAQVLSYFHHVECRNTFSDTNHHRDARISRFHPRVSRE